MALIDLSPEFTYSSVPRLSPYSFLQAKAKNSSPYTVLAGPANVFLDNNFIAKVNEFSLKILEWLIIIVSLVHNMYISGHSVASKFTTSKD